MYDIFPDLLKVYYLSITVALLVGATLDISIYRIVTGYRNASEQVDEMVTTSGAGYDSYGYEDEPVYHPMCKCSLDSEVNTDADIDAVARRLLNW